MNYPKPLTILSLSTVITLTAASGSYGQTAVTEATSKNHSRPEISVTPAVNQPPASTIVVKTILPSRAKPTVPYQWLQPGQSVIAQAAVATVAGPAAVIEAETPIAVAKTPILETAQLPSAAATDSDNAENPDQATTQATEAASSEPLEVTPSKAESDEAGSAVVETTVAPPAASPTPTTPANTADTIVPIAPAQPDTPLPPGTGTTPPNSTSSGTKFSTPAATPQPGTSATNASELTRKIDLPDYLNSNPNPLQFPTKPSEVMITGAQPLSLELAIELAERNDRTIEQAKIQLERNQAVLREAQADRFPSIFVQGDFTRSKSADAELNVRQQRKDLERDLESDDFATRFQAQQSEASIRESLADADDPRTRLTTSLNLNYDLFTAGRRSGQIEAAERQVRISELEIDRVTAQTRFDVADIYYQLQDAEEQITINEAAVKSSESNLRDTQAQFEAGLGTKFDVLRVQVQLANNLQQLETARANREIQRRRLAQRLSLPEKSSSSPTKNPAKLASGPSAWSKPLSSPTKIALN